jgi:hypothetical protein
MIRMKLGERVLIIIMVFLLIASSVLGPVNALKINSSERGLSAINPKDPDSGSIGDKPELFVKVNRIRALEPVDSLDEADFYLKVNIDNFGYQTSPKPLEKNDDDIYFGEDYDWIPSEELYGDKNIIDITIQLWDRDSEWYDGSDDRLDISPLKDDCSLDIQYDLRTGNWDGEDSGTGHSEGNSGESWDKCEIWFEIWHENGDEFYVNSNGPYNGKVGEEIELKATASNGKAPYHSWHWTVFDDGGILKQSASQNMKITINNPGTYNALVQVKDQNNKFAEDWTTIKVKEENNPGNKYAVLIAGGAGDDMDDNFAATAEHGYDCFKKLGYSDSQICWLSGKNKKPNADKKTTYSNVKWAIKDWLDDRSDKNSDCFILLCDHGDPTLFGGVAVHPGSSGSIFSIVLPFVLDWWLDDLDYKTLTLCISSCYSGKFIKYVSGRNRIVITTTDSDSVSYSAGENVFMSPFFSELEKTSSTYKPSYGDAWMAGDKRVDGKRNPDEMNPKIDDNGDNKGHGTDDVDILPLGGDGLLALNTYP